MPSLLSSTSVHAANKLAVPVHRWRAMWLVLACVLASRILLLVFAQWLPGDDGLRYLQEAQNLVHYGVFSHLPPPSPAPTTHDLPLFPLLLSCILRVIPDAAAAMRVMSLLNAVFFTTAAAAVFQLARLFTPQSGVAVLSTLLFAAFPESLPYSLFSMPESMFLMFFLWAVLLQASFLRGAPTWRFFASFVLLGASILSKPAALFFAAFFVLCGLAFWPRQHQSTSVRILWLTLGLLAELVTLSPWIVRNRIVFGSATLTTITGTNLFDANYALMLEDQHEADPAGVQQRQIAGLHWNNPVEEARVKGAIAKREILAHWRSYLRTNLKHHPRLYLGTGALALLRLLGDAPGVSALESWQAHPSLAAAHLLPAPILLLQLASWLFLAALYLGAFLGALLLLRQRAWFALAFTVLPLAYFAVIIGPIVYTRYRLPMDPFLAILAANCIQKVKAYVLV